MAGSRKTLWILAALCVTLLAALAYLIWIKEPKVIPISSRDVAGKSLSFLLRDQSLHSGTYECHSGICSEKDASAPELAWKLLALSGIYGATGDPGARKLMDTILSNDKFNRPHPLVMMWNLLPFHVAYLKTGDPSFENFFDIESLNALEVLQHESPRNSALTEVPFLRVPLMRVLLQAAKNFSGGDSGRYVPTDPNAVRARETAAAIKNSLDSDENSGRLREQMACWFFLSRTLWYETTGDEKELERALTFFNPDDPVNSIKKRNPHTLQMVLPCADGALILSKRDEKFKTAFNRIIQEIVLSAFDSDVRPLCKGGNAFLVGMGKYRDCGIEMMSIADGSWITYLLTESDNRMFSLIDKGRL